jgi:hypothetical protein
VSQQKRIQQLLSEPACAIKIIAAGIVVLILLAPPVFAYVNLGFEQQYLPDNADGSWNVGSTVHLAVNTDCPSFSIDWNDGAVETYSMGNTNTVFVSHAYGAANTYTVTATGLCSGGGSDFRTVVVEGGGFVGGQTLVGAVAVLLGMLGIGLAFTGPSLKPPPSPAKPTGEEDDGVPTVDLDAKIPLLKTDKDVERQQRFFDDQRAGWREPKAGGRVYLDRFHEVPHRLMDDPLTAHTVGPFLKLFESGTDLVYIGYGAVGEAELSGPTKVEYDAEADRYYYDFTSSVSAKDAATQFGNASLELLSHRATPYLFKGADATAKGLYNDYKYLENLGDKMPGLQFNQVGDYVSPTTRSGLARPVARQVVNLVRLWQGAGV